MGVSLRGIDVPHWVGVSAVDDVPTGIHRWPDLSSPVRPLDEQAVRDELFTAALEQGLARDASFVAMSGTRLADLDDHAYREAQLLAGLAEGRLHLMAYALGAAASGMTFRDSDLAHLLGQRRRRTAVDLRRRAGVPHPPQRAARVAGRRHHRLAALTALRGERLPS